MNGSGSEPLAFRQKKTLSAVQSLLHEFTQMPGKVVGGCGLFGL
jgi:hypothetical protein